MPGTDFTYTLASDLHVDMGSFPRALKSYDWGENVIIAGDISNGLGQFKFIEKMRAKGHKFWGVDGNHEHYSNKTSGRSMGETERRFYDMMPHDIEPPQGLHIIGLNGWYEVEDEYHWRSYMNDARHGVLDKETVNAKARASASTLDAILSASNDKFIVVTHTAPSLDTMDPRFEGSEGNPYYFNPYMGDVRARHADKILVWNHGHTHAPADKIVDDVRTVCNPRGYPRECPLWQPKEITVRV